VHVDEGPHQWRFHELIVVAVCIREIANTLVFVSLCNKTTLETLRYKCLYIPGQPDWMQQMTV